MNKRWQQKEKARKLRKLGWTYPEIQERISVHRVTLSNWCRDIKLSPKQVKSRGGRYANRLKGAEANFHKRQKEIKKIREESKKEIRKLSFYEFKIAGAALYWGEGAKASGLSFSNSDAELVRFMMKWFREVCEVPDEKIRANLYLHTGLNEERMKRSWSKVTKINLKQFSKTIFKQEGSASRKYNQNEYIGTIKIQIFDEDLKHKIIGWIEQLQYYGIIGH